MASNQVVKVDIVDSKKNKGKKLADKSVRAFIDVNEAKDLIGGGSESDVLKLKVYPDINNELSLLDYYPVGISRAAESFSGDQQLWECYFLDCRLTDENDNEITKTQLVESLNAGKKVEIIYVEHLGDTVEKNGDEITFTTTFDDLEFTQLLGTSVRFSPQDSQNKVWDISSMGLVCGWVNTTDGFIFYPCELALTEATPEIGGSFAVVYTPSQG